MRTLGQRRIGETTRDHRTRLGRTILTINRTGPCTPAEVWRRYMTVSEWPSWSPQIIKVMGIDGRICAGDQGVVVGPLGVKIPFTIVAVDEETMRWTWRVSVGPLKIQMIHGVDPSSNGSRAWVRIMLPAPIALGYAPFAALALHKLTRASL
ncbi:MAG: SRPBCC family protein [Antricoccus sp.]